MGSARWLWLVDRYQLLDAVSRWFVLESARMALGPLAGAAWTASANPATLRRLLLATAAAGSTGAADSETQTVRLRQAWSGLVDSGSMDFVGADGSLAIAEHRSTTGAPKRSGKTSSSCTSNSLPGDKSRNRRVSRRLPSLWAVSCRQQRRSVWWAGSTIPREEIAMNKILISLLFALAALPALA